MTAAAVLRAAGPADAGPLLALVRLLDPERSEADLALRLAALPDGHAVLLAERDAAPVGWLHLFLAWRLTSPPFAEIGGLAVAPGHRRQGVGRQLLAAGEAWARERGAAALRVRVAEQREEAPALYRAAGFRPLKRQQVFAKDL